ncbi:MAG: hypothetical protein PGN30_09840 [Mycolicibacterium neoaurum]|uniref:hypothetical protein n=1 Tax=Mycolicibacterium neoaurum TaxID=1795 RepID=UPI002FFBEAAE
MPIDVRVLPAAPHHAAEMVPALTGDKKLPRERVASSTPGLHPHLGTPQRREKLITLHRDGLTTLAFKVATACEVENKTMGFAAKPDDLGPAARRQNSVTNFNFTGTY